MPPPRFLYLHGFGSGPRSHKGVVLEQRFAERGLRLERLDLRVPSLEHLRLSVMMQTVRAAIGDDEQARAVLIGSSLGGLTAARVAEEDARVCALVLLAPAFQMIGRWRERLGESGFRQWQESGWLAIHDYANDRPARVDFGFAEDTERIDARSGGLPDVRVPTLIVHGDKDEVVPAATSRRFRKDKPWVRLVETDDGHELAASVPRIEAELEWFLRGFGW